MNEPLVSSIYLSLSVDKKSHAMYLISSNVAVLLSFSTRKREKEHEIDVEKITPNEVIDPIFTERLQKPIQMLVDLQQSVKKTDSFVNEGNDDVSSRKGKGMG